MTVPESNVIKKIRAIQPASIRLHQPDGEPVDVAIPNVRQRWRRLGSILESYQWIRMECRDKRGNIIGVVDNDAPPSELEDLTNPEQKHISRTDQTVSLMLRAQDVAMSRLSEHTKVATTGYQGLIEALTKVVASLAKQNSVLLEAAKHSVDERAQLLADLVSAENAGEESSDAEKAIAAILPQVIAGSMAPRK